MIGALASTLVVILVLLVSGRMLVDEVEGRFEHEAITGSAELWNAVVDSQLDHMKAAMSGVTRDREIRNALAKGDTAKLLEAASPAYKRLSTTGVLTKLQMTDLQGRVAFSQPDGFSGKTGKTLVNEALTTGKVVRGVERDDDGRLYATLAFPLLKRGKPVGVAVYLKDLREAVQEFRNGADAELLILDPDGGLEYASSPELAGQVGKLLPSPGETAFQLLEQEGGTFALAMNPLRGPDGSLLAYAVSASDQTDTYAAARNLNLVTYLLVAAGLLVSLVTLMWYIKRSFQPLDGAVATLQRIAQCDLTVEIPDGGKDEIGRLLDAMKETVVALRGMIRQIKEGGSELAASSTGLQQVAENTSRSVEQQMADTGQVASAMTEMAATVGEVAENAERAAEVACNAREDASSGRQVVQQSIEAINGLASGIEVTSGVIQRLENESREIGGVLDVIRGIAEQTNLLALNAAIEAARAGEQGRGFAVVADEVRSLASRTQNSTEDIHQMIERLQSGTHEAVATMNQSLEQVRSVVERTGDAGTSLETISEAVEHIAGMNTQIAKAVEQQRVVVDEINRSVATISGAAEQSAEGARATSRASEEMRRWTERLNQSVDRFHLPDAG